MVFDKPGKHNTQRTVELALAAARERGIRDVVIATCTGETPLYFRDAADLHRVAVTLAYGYRRPDYNEVGPEEVQKLTDAGIEVVTSTHLLTGADKGILKEAAQTSPVAIMANTLRMLGQGTKVAVEIVVTALEAGKIPHMKPGIAVAGTGGGADTAVILRAAYAHEILNCKIDEYLCKPRLL